MQIDDFHIQADIVDIIQELKSQLSLNGVELFAKFFDSGDNVMVCCPYHKGGQERRPSAGIRKTDGMFHCLACGETHTLPEMISHCFGRQDFGVFGAIWLKQNFLSVGVENRKALNLNFARRTTPKDPPKYVTEEELDKYRYIHPYMYKRGLNDDSINLFDIGYDINTDSITFPVRDIHGNCLFVARRSVNSKRFDLPKGIDKPLYGLYEVRCELNNKAIDRLREHGKFGGFITGASEIYICEGLFDCLRLWSNNKIAVAGFGCLFSDYQIKQLRQLPTRKLILATDNDDAGMAARRKLKKVLGKDKIITEALIPKDKKDIGDCSDDEIKNLKDVL